MLPEWSLPSECEDTIDLNYTQSIALRTDHQPDFGLRPPMAGREPVVSSMSSLACPGQAGVTWTAHGWVGAHGRRTSAGRIAQDAFCDSGHMCFAPPWTPPALAFSGFL